MSGADDDDGDYLSDKFLNPSASTTAKPTTYSQIRKEAQKKAQQKNEQNRHKSRRQLELESREEGLSKSLFERAKEEEDSGIGSSNKALSIMMKMGFKPGQSLGNIGERSPTTANPQVSPSSKDTSPTHPTVANTKHKTEPLPIQEWAGRKGIGLGKRARSPSAAERLAKMAKMADDVGHRDFRDRARDEYNNRRAEGRLVPAQITCRTLDEQLGISFNVLSLNPNNHDTFPGGLIGALALHTNLAVISERHGDSIQNKMKQQMQADALQPLHEDLLEEQGPGAPKMSASTAPEDQFSHELLEEATQFLRLQAHDRLHLVLSYLRYKHAYCFWCGVKYEDEEDMQNQCPGTEEDDHD